MSDRLLILRRATIITPLRSIREGVLVVRGDKIDYLGGRLPEDVAGEELDLSGCLLTPGLIDLHLHGALGVDFGRDPCSGWEAALRYHTAGGTTGFLATLMSAPHERLLEALARGGAYCSGGGDSALARCLGLHLEGPYLNPERRGVHPVSALRKPCLEQVRGYRRAAGGWLKMITLAPELDEGAGIIRRLCREEGLLVAGGHSRASYDCACRAVEAGLSYAVHTGNAAGPLHQREPGFLGAMLDDGRVFCELIADGVHLHPAMLRLFYRLKGAGALVLATDSSPLAGLPAGWRRWQGERMRVCAERVSDAGGRLAGSCLTMARALRNMIKWSGCSLAEALQMAALNPARLLGLQERKGSLAPGMDADLLVFAPDLRLKMVMVGGKMV